jgi:hypothetical protein
MISERSRQIVIYWGVSALSRTFAESGCSVSAKDARRQKWKMENGKWQISVRHAKVQSNILNNFSFVNFQLPFAISAARNQRISNWGRSPILMGNLYEEGF